MLTGRTNGFAVRRPVNAGQWRLKVLPSASRRNVETKAPSRVNDITTLEGAKNAKLKLAANCFGTSMSQDPLLTWVTDGSCPDQVARFFSNVAHMALQAAPDRSTCWALQQTTTSPPAPGAETVAPDPVAPMVVCIAFEYPRSYPSDWAWASRGLFRALLSAPSLRAAGTFFKMIGIFDEGKQRFYKAHGPFLYICCFGTAPEFQGKGLGSELMGEVLAHATRLGVPAYLEASGVDSCRFYQRHGFQILQEIRVEPGAPTVFLMANYLGKDPATC
ncbi:hypothetical protein PLESTB_000214500 [Pleodorina starrii]|uniref:N-acetyltransferase domain-containing protein n=1 Tax=Pleodorina starrii TaxID=330485 RepID=A0A9W6EXX1_9CHLO|nr:hypothetical protein PLESTM_001540200 [Pleodorina starrii]GLC49393.1 hypothetical protein PLESTB_000214500 [Pleodorina starrii]GLC73344.1 hypothetical protein PLESTF_001365400 [Pleodorina starrii]